MFHLNGMNTLVFGICQPNDLSTAQSPCRFPEPVVRELSVFPVGADEFARRTLDVYFERQLGGRCRLGSETDADVSLIDADSAQSALLIEQQLMRHPRRPMILLTLHPQNVNIPNGITVPKPVRTEALAATLEDLGRRLRRQRVITRSSWYGESAPGTMLAGDAKGPSVIGMPTTIDSAAARLAERERHFYVGSLPDVDFESPDDVAKIFYDVNDFLQGYVRRAIRQGLEEASVVRLRCTAFGQLEIYPFAARIVASAADSALMAASRLPVRNQDVTIELLRDAPQWPPDGTKAVAAENLQWNLALWASRGRLPAGTDLERCVVLRRWPNLTRMLTPPQAPRILGLWARKPVSLRDTPALLGVPQRNVYALYSACSAVGMAVASG